MTPAPLRWSVVSLLVACLLLTPALQAKDPVPRHPSAGEAHWLLDLIGRDTTEMMLFARGAKTTQKADFGAGYYLDHHRNAEAEKVARQAAEVYSALGLDTAGYVMERLERWDEGEKFYLAIAQRYPSSSNMLNGFWGRNQDRAPRFKEGWQKAVSALFPKGLEAAALPDLHDAPADGVKVYTKWAPDPEARPNYNIVVAVNGQRVRSVEQYRLLRELHVNEPLEFTYWDGKAYLTHTATDTERTYMKGDTFKP